MNANTALKINDAIDQAIRCGESVEDVKGQVQRALERAIEQRAAEQLSLARSYDNADQIRLSRESRYISNAQHRADKARLTRALNKGDLDGILDAVEKTIDGWDGLVWPDDWRRWFIAVDDVYFSREATPAQRERAAAISRRS